MAFDCLRGRFGTDWPRVFEEVRRFAIRNVADHFKARVDLLAEILCKVMNTNRDRFWFYRLLITRGSSSTEIPELRLPGGDEEELAVADLVCFLAYSGLRIGEALPLKWADVNWGEQIMQVKREKRGIMPWLPLVPALETLLRDMERRASGELLFPAPFKPGCSLNPSPVRRRIIVACEKSGIGLVTPHGLRSYFVTQARKSGLTDGEIAMLIGDKTGPAINAQTYGDVRPEHLLAQARKITLTATSTSENAESGSSIKSSITLPGVALGCSLSPQGNEAAKVPANIGG